jgi:hypothetical protein
MKTHPSNLASRDNAAFTMLEIIVSITVFSFILISVLGCWKCVVSGKMISEDAAAAAQRSRIGIKTVVDALTCTELDVANYRHYGFVTDTSGKFASLSLAARLPLDFPGSGLFGDNVMRRVTFNVEKDTDGKLNLIMYQSPLLAILDDQNTPYPITLARDVTDFGLEFWDPQQMDWGVDWLLTNALPQMVRVTLGCGHSASNPDVPYNRVCRTVVLSNAHQ